MCLIDPPGTLLAELPLIHTVRRSGALILMSLACASVRLHRGGLASSDLSALRHGGTEVRRVPDLGGKARRRRRLECDVHAENTVVGRPHRTDADSSSGLTLFDIRRLPRPSSTGTQGFSSGTVRPPLSAFSAPAPRREAANGAAARTQAMHF